MKLQCVALALLAAAISCTGTDGPGNESSSSYFTTTLAAEWDEMGYWNVSCVYSFDFDRPGPIDNKWIVTGRFLANSYDWAYLDGDTTWVDTLMVFQEAQHDLIMKPRREWWGNCS